MLKKLILMGWMICAIQVNAQNWPREMYRIQLGVMRSNMDGKILDYREIMSKADFQHLNEMGILRKADVFYVAPTGQTNVNFQRVILGDYLDEATAVRVWREIRKLGDKYPELGFDKSFIYGSFYRWSNQLSGWRARTVAQTRFTVQVATVDRINADSFDAFIQTFGEVFFEYANGKYKVYVGLFERQDSPKAVSILSMAQSIGFRSAFIHQL